VLSGSTTVLHALPLFMRGAKESVSRFDFFSAHLSMARSVLAMLNGSDDSSEVTIGSTRAYLLR
jgi:hypothetical protein